MADAIQIDAVAEEPPTAKGSGDLCEQQGPYTSGAASSAAIQLTHVPAMGECFVTFIVSGNPVRLNFGGSNAVAAADTNSVLFPVGKYRLRISANNSGWFRHIQVTGAGSIDVYRSSR